MNTFYVNHHSVRHALRQLALTLLSTSLLLLPPVSGHADAAAQLITGAYTTRAGVGQVAEGEVCRNGVAPIGGTKTCPEQVAEACSEGVAPIGGTSTCPEQVAEGEACSEGVAPIGGTKTCA